MQWTGNITEELRVRSWKSDSGKQTNGCKLTNVLKAIKIWLNSMRPNELKSNKETKIRYLLKQNPMKQKEKQIKSYPNKIKSKQSSQNRWRDHCPSQGKRAWAPERAHWPCPHVVPDGDAQDDNWYQSRGLLQGK